MTDVTLTAPQSTKTISPSGKRERLLLMLSAAFLTCNLIALALVRGYRPGDWLLLAVWTACAIFGVWALELWLPNRDFVIFPVAMFLCGCGLVVIDRLSEGYIYNFADRQTLWMIIGTALMLLAATRPEPIRWLREYRYLLLILGLALLLGTIAFGTHPTGAAFAPQLWLGIGSFYFQPSELLKIILVGFLASYLAEHYPTLRAPDFDQGQSVLPYVSARVWGPVLLMWSLCVVILVWQRDLGTATLFFGVFLVLLYVASGNSSVILGGTVLLILAAFIAYQQFSVVKLRVDIWLDPWRYAEGNGYQIVQSLMALASGGIFGTGIGQGSPDFIPVVHSDSILAAIAEEWGLLGASTILICLLLLTSRGFKAAVNQPNRPFLALSGIGFSAMIAIQTLLIAGGVFKVLPLTGVTLPFVSYGGSSMVVTFIMVGFLLRLSARRDTP